jgi:serine/threonine-protein kinase
MGEVYEAEDTRKHRVVALKLISPEFSGNSSFRERMQREADAAGRLTEPHVVPIHDYGEIDGQLYLDMRLIEGTDLSTLLRTSGPLSPGRAVAIVRQIAAALDAAHANGVTHRDVKPENILITGNDFAYLVDFGIARAAADPGLTQTGTAIGSYNYMAPERLTGDEVTHRADIYALACVLDECLTGSPPYPCESIERLITAHLMDPAPRPSLLRPGRVPPALDQVIAIGMAKKPGERYRSAGDLAEAAHDALTTGEQHLETAIIQQGKSTTMRPTAASGGWTNYPGPSSQPGLMVPSPSHDDQTTAGPAPEGASSDAGRQPAPSGRKRGRAGPKSGRKGKLAILIGVPAILAVAAAGVLGYRYLVPRPSQPTENKASGQTVVPLTGLDFHVHPGGVALDRAGNLYVTSQGQHGRVVELPPGSSTAKVLPFSGLFQPQGLTVDSAGTVYVADFTNRVLKLDVGANKETVLPFTGLNFPEGVAVDSQGGVYVADRGNSRVVKLAAGSNTQTVLPFTGLKYPDGVAVDPAGNVFVTDSDNNRVLKLDIESNAQTVLPFTGVDEPWGIALDPAGNVFVTEHNNNRVLVLRSESKHLRVLPFTDLHTPLAVAVDNDGNVYVADRGDDRVVKLGPHHHQKEGGGD